MRSPPTRSDRPDGLRRRIGRLERLPLRAETARAFLSEPADEEPRPGPGGFTTSRLPEIDPGWALALETGDGEPLSWIAEAPWWPRAAGPGAEAVDRLWKHSVATSCAARRMASEAGADDVRRVSRLGLLLGLGYWALAAVDADALARLLAVADPAGRREAERDLLGTDAAALGRGLCDRWGLDPILADAVWLHADLGNELAGSHRDAETLGLLQKAHHWAERTPWALFPAAAQESGPTDPRIRLLMAEVQVRCGTGFPSVDASAHEERLARAHARLLLQHRELERTSASRGGLIEALIASEPGESASDWADRAALTWCREPGIAAARVVWHGDDPREAGTDPDPAVLRIPLGPPARPLAEVQVRLDPGGPPLDPARHPTAPAWGRWAGLIALRDRHATRLDRTAESHRGRVERDAKTRDADRLASLAEFAAGAGHELNNPLAVILGRAQLLLCRAADPDTTRSLRAIIGQARRAHRIVRDLMYVARPPAPRPRPCQPDEVLRAGLRDLQGELEARGLRLQADLGEPGPCTWIDPDALRHLTDVLTRNALEATPSGGTIRVSARATADRIEWTFRDGGRGLDPREGRHLFDPFFCGRQAGRGLGLGLPRVARFLALAGGEIRWHANPSQGTTFQVTLPLRDGPDAKG